MIVCLSVKKSPSAVVKVVKWECCTLNNYIFGRDKKEMLEPQKYCHRFHANSHSYLPIWKNILSILLHLNIRTEFSFRA
jgi:hypothetical protein